MTQSVWKIRNVNTGLFLNNIVKGNIAYNKYGKLFNKLHLAEKSLSKVGIEDHEVVKFDLIEAFSEDSDISDDDNDDEDLES